MWPPRVWRTCWRISVLLLGVSLILAGCKRATSISPQPTINALKNTITKFAVPTAQSGPVGITVGSDGNLWFTEWNGNQIGRITPGGQITEFPIPTPMCLPDGMTAGPDGNLWFAERDTNQIGRITPAGVITEFALQPPATPWQLAVGADGQIWFIDSLNSVLGRISRERRASR